MKAKITRIILLLSVILLSGCLSTNPARALRTISQRIPPGTPQADAIRIMKLDGYESEPCGPLWRHPNGETVFCFWQETKILKNSRWFFVHFKNQKVVSVDGWRTEKDFFFELFRP